MNKNANTEPTPDEHDEEICSKGKTLCHECRCAAADLGAA